MSNYYLAFDRTLCSDRELKGLRKISCSENTPIHIRETLELNIKDLKLNTYNWFDAISTETKTYFHWKNLGLFCIESTKNLIGYRLYNDQPEVFSAYLLSHVLSFLLNEQGQEALHGTAIQNQEFSFALVGQNGVGKSTLAGHFANCGYQVITDDLIVLSRKRNHYQVLPGARRIKLFPDSLGTLHWDKKPLFNIQRGFKKKLLFFKGLNLQPKPLKAIIHLIPQDSPLRPNLHPLAHQEAFISLVQNTFNSVLDSSKKRASRFATYKTWSREIPIYRLEYHKEFKTLDQIKKLIENETVASQP